MADIVNLRTRRKQTARDNGRALGAVAAAQHGESKADAALRVARTDKAERDLSAHRRDPDESEAPR